MFDTADSTNTFLKEQADLGAEHLSIAVTKSQSAGRGRGDRVWVSPEGNVFWSILLRPDSSWPSLTSLPLVLALAVHRSLAQIVGSDSGLKIKWPNDILLDGKKVCGMLLETSVKQRRGEGHPISWCVVGIGINVNSHPEATMNYQATDLVTSGVENVTRDVVIEILSAEVANIVSLWSRDGFPAFRVEVEGSLAFLGEEIDVVTGVDREQRQQGRLIGLSKDGLAKIEAEDGLKTLSAGEVFGI